MTNILSILCRAYYVQHGSFLGIENEKFYSMFKEKPTTETLIETLGLNPSCMSNTTKLRLIELLATNNLDEACELLSVKTREECIDIAKTEQLYKKNIVFKKPSISPSCEKLAYALMTFYRNNPSVDVLYNNKLYSIISLLRQQAFNNRGVISKDIKDIFFKHCPPLHIEQDIEEDVIVSKSGVKTRFSIPMSELQNTMKFMPEHIAYSSLYLSLHDFKELGSNYISWFFKPSMSNLISISASTGMPIVKLLDLVGLYWISPLESFDKYNAVLMDRGNGTISIFTRYSYLPINNVVVSNKIAIELLQSGNVAEIAWDGNNSAFFNNESGLPLASVYSEGGYKNVFY